MEYFSQNNSENESILEDEELQPQVQSIVNKLRNRKKSKFAYIGNIALLVITLVIFILTGFFENPLIDLIVLAVVILFHEFGHFIAMKSFGYKDIKIFFIPFLGAAITGKNKDISSAKKAVISLAGPLPGIFIGYISGIIGIILGNEMLIYISSVLVILNGLNLLPLYPFDGGRFMSEVYFIRNRYLELIFKSLAVIILISVSIFNESYLFMVIGFGLLFTLKTSYNLSKLSKEIKEEIKIDFRGDLLDQPNSTLNRIISKVIITFPNVSRDSQQINLVDDLWERIKYTPPKVSSTAILSFVYAIPFLIVFAPLLMYPNEIAEMDMEAFSNVYSEEGTKRESIKYYPDGKVHLITTWKNGNRDGLWSEYDKNMKLISKYRFENDEFIHKVKFTGSSLDTLTFNELTPGEKRFIREKLK